MAHVVAYKLLPILFLLLLFFIFSIPTAFSNGGDQRVVDGKYLINLSRAPFTPKAGEKTGMLISFVDLKTNKLIPHELILKIRVAKLGSGDGKREFVFEQGNIRVQGGVLEFPYTFTSVGLHEILFDFALARDPEKVYEAPDFLLDVQPSTSKPLENLPLPVVGFSIAIGIIFGFVIGRFAR